MEQNTLTCSMPVDEFAGGGEELVIRCEKPATHVDKHGYYLCQEHAAFYKVDLIPESPETVEARRQLIWKAKREGYLMAIADMSASLGRLRSACEDLFHILRQMEDDHVDPVP